MTIKLPKIIGHRGCAAYAPENTLEGIHTAADMDVEWVELDVKLTKDDVPILFHDDMLDRTTNGAGPVAETPYAQIQELETGSWFGDSFAGTKIPTLEEAIDVLLERDLGLNLEIKPCPGRERETTEIALDILSTIWDAHDRLLISSFQYECLDAAFEMANDWHRGFLLPEEWPDDWKTIAEDLRVSTFNVNGNTVTRDDIDRLRQFGKPILAYTINDPDRAHFLQSWGVDGFFSDAPDVIKDGILTLH